MFSYKFCEIFNIFLTKHLQVTVSLSSKQNKTETKQISYLIIRNIQNSYQIIPTLVEVAFH